MTSLLVVTGPPGAGKSSVARLLAEKAERSVLVEGDAFFRSLASGRIDPWLSEAQDQNTVITKAAASAAGRFAAGGYVTVFDGIVGPWFLGTFLEATELARLDYVVLLPPVERCVRQVLERHGHPFADVEATRKMHAEFERADIGEDLVVRDLRSGAGEVADLVQNAQLRGGLSYP